MQNAIILSAAIELDGPLTAWLTLDLGQGRNQGFGGYALYLPKSYTHHNALSCAGHFIVRCLQIAGVSDWDQMPGQCIRIKRDSTSVITAIGHFINDDWFTPATDLLP